MTGIKDFVSKYKLIAIFPIFLSLFSCHSKTESRQDVWYKMNALNTYQLLVDSYSGKPNTRSGHGYSSKDLKRFHRQLVYMKEIIELDDVDMLEYYIYINMTDNGNFIYFFYNNDMKKLKSRMAGNKMRHILNEYAEITDPPDFNRERTRLH